MCVTRDTVKTRENKTKLNINKKQQSDETGIRIAITSVFALYTAYYAPRMIGIIYHKLYAALCLRRRCVILSSDILGKQTANKYTFYDIKMPELKPHTAHTHMHIAHTH